MAYPDQVTLYEVGPRDGLQNESALVPVGDKLHLIAALAGAGLSRIEIGSFVRPDWIPQLADTDQVAQRLPRRAGLRYSALVPNQTGLDRAVTAGLREVAVFMSSSETHNQKNTNKSIAQSLEHFGQIVPAAKAQGLFVRAYLSTVWGCPYEGKVDPVRALEISRKLLAIGCDEISLGDTIGVGNPLQTRQILEPFLAGGFEASRIALHLHDTNGTALANCLVGLELGITTFDTSIGGMGGCPYAPGASGNLATEDLASMLLGLGIGTGVDLDKLFAAGELAEELSGSKLPGRRLQAALGRRHPGDAREGDST